MAEEIEASGYFELSALTGKNLSKLFLKTVEIVLNNRQEKTGESKTEDGEKSSKKEEDTSREKTKKAKKVAKSEKQENVSDDEGVVIRKAKRKKKKTGCVLL